MAMFKTFLGFLLFALLNLLTGLESKRVHKNFMKEEIDKAADLPLEMQITQPILVDDSDELDKAADNLAKPYMSVRHGVFSGDSPVFVDSHEAQDHKMLPFAHEKILVSDITPERHLIYEKTTMRPVVISSTPVINIDKKSESDVHVEHLKDLGMVKFTFKATTHQTKGSSTKHYGEAPQMANFFRPPPVLFEYDGKKPPTTTVPSTALAMFTEGPLAALMPPPSPPLKYSDVKVNHVRSANPSDAPEPKKDCVGFGKPCRKHAECCNYYCEWYNMQCGVYAVWY